MGSLFSIKSAALEAPCTFEQVSSWKTRVEEAQPVHAYEFYDYLALSGDISFSLDPMSDRHSNERLSVYDTEQWRRPRSPLTQPGNSFSHATIAAASPLPEEGPIITISVFSHRLNGPIDLTATVLRDENCANNWISRDLVDSLGLKSFEEFNADSMKPGQFDDGEIFCFDGTVELSWTWKTPHHLCNSIDYADFLVVPVIASSRRSMIWLKASLCAGPDAELKTSAPIVAPVPQSVKPPLETSLSRQLAKIASIAGMSTESAEDSRSASDKGGLIDENNLFGDDSEEARWADEWMRSFEKRVKSRFKEKRKGAIGRVKIAILDTGVDHNHNNIDGAKTGEAPVIMKCCSFVGPIKDATDDSRTQDSDGHGTHIAGLIMTLAPCAEIYVAKISENRKVPVGHRIPDAINWAIENSVDIISMSFGFPGSLAHEDIRAALETASSTSKNILLFAAASNKGKYSKPTFPANDNNVICIYATDGHGYGSNLNPQLHNRQMCFATPGHCIKSLKAGTKADEVQGSGTSYATPIAAAIAANILELAFRTNMDAVFLKKLKSRDGMERVFLTMVPKNDVNDLDCLHLETLFHRHMEDRSIHDVILVALDP